ncbi:Mth938-like domain-containing protein [Chachezhania antarctica]|uniref:Mth938-like domain-containing protein n=1 Tax=Chachezhania antarctica TaxID=2340860 RepID=UPI000EAE65BA|nr:Mth938-like domain-containing protein [Chachezhania antarctica]|tara:strand:+ start:1520 stop:1873 length:354 start_codon:yes stop_codon:yes gene_type:complete
MQLNEAPFPDVKPVDGYGPGFFRVGGEVYYGAVITGPEGTVAWGGFEDTAALTRLAAKVDVVLVGTGPEIAHLPGPFRAAIEAEGMGVESMASPAACRSFNVLASEGRRVALAVLPV